MSEQKTMAQAILAAQRSIQSVAKSAWNDYSKYKYASSEALMEEGRRALHGAGLALIMESWTLEDVEESRCLVHATFTLVHESGAERHMDATLPAYEVKGRPFDKAVAGALTYLEGYFIRGLLCLPRVDEKEEVDQRDDTNHEPPPKKEKPKPQKSGFANFQAFAKQYEKAQLPFLRSMAINSANKLATMRGQDPTWNADHLATLEESQGPFDKPRLLELIWDMMQEAKALT